MKPMNEVHARHMLGSRRQQPGETLDEYMQNTDPATTEQGLQPEVHGR